MSQSARLELRVKPETKALVERAAALTQQSVSAFVTAVLLERATEVVHGAGAPPPGPRPVGGWSFALPAGWDDPLDDLADYR